ncbi:MAG: cbb3-type cytochrome c oxidase subunit I [Acidimicrobiales bacterium]|jgi:heme/copper-type cytochrome/quinol oxidase subunit 1|nr:cbb3-type cytochrome c oxidase subunit I [Acidimicrobiales bacterium]
MTMTDSPPATDTAPAVSSPAVAGLYDALTTTDHRRIGRLWLRTGLVGLLGAVVIGVLLGIESTDAASTDVFGGDNAYFQMWALYRIGLALLVAAPLFIGLAMVVVPMQVGSTNIAFPRAALGAAWGFMIGAGIMVVSVLAAGGWGATDRATGDERDAVALTLVGMGLVIISILLASMCIATTVISLRVKGMTLMHAPLFAWSMLVTAAVWLLTLPVLLANLVIAYVDLHNGPGTFGGGLNGSVDIYHQIAWLVEQPQVYAFAIPALGVLGSVVPVAAGVRAARHAVSLGLIGLFGLLAIGAWSQPFFQNDGAIPHDEQFLFIAFGLAAVLPVLGAMGGAGDTMAKGKDAIVGLPAAHLMGALGGGLLLLAGVAAGAVRVIEPLELGGSADAVEGIGTLAVSGVGNLVLFGAITAAVGGFWFWASKIGGHELSPMMGRLAIADLLLGGVLLGGAQVVSGFFDTVNDPRFVPTAEAADALAWISTAGAVLVALGALGVVAAIAGAVRRGPAGGDDPWGGQTLEWSTVDGVFTEPPALVTSEAPLLDRTELEPEVDSTEGEES